LFLFDEVKKDYYETLGIKKTASNEEIKRAYFAMVRKYQPDRFPEEFKEIRAAYETLTDRKKRAEYDDIGTLPSSVAPIFHEARRLDRFGRYSKAAELYALILKSHPELDKVWEEYAGSLLADDKTGKATEVWEELCRRHPDNPRYARELGKNYIDRGWNKKAIVEARRALALDRSSIDSWSLLISCVAISVNGNSRWDELTAVSDEALEAVKAVKVDEWKKIHLLSYALVTSGIKKSDKARGHLKEIIRITREGGREGQQEGQQALREILMALPEDGLSTLYPELKEMVALVPEMNNPIIRMKLEAVRLNSLIESLKAKKFHKIFCDLFWILNAEFEDVEDELEVIAIEHTLLADKDIYAPQIRRLKEEFPELYALHSSFFNEALRVRDVDKMMHQREKKYKKLKRRASILFDDDDEPESEATETVRRAQPKVGRNDPCPCGSGRKYKHCCGA
jgi:tetratricopeptide (TPR) repeat protein